jgi:hypothetical protein|tara:strand:- start:404 stop:559 length:156 start_codon:yes stop_codon:yes gene_type:complete
MFACGRFSGTSRQWTEEGSRTFDFKLFDKIPRKSGGRMLLLKRTAFWQKIN